MPTARNTGHRLRLGTFTSTGITTAYAITAFPVQADQLIDNQPAVEWAAPYQSLPPEYVRVAGYMDGLQLQDGFLHGVLGPFRYWTFGMVGYVLTNIFPSNAYSSLVSMMLYDASDNAVFLNCTLYRPVIGRDYKPAYGGWEDINLKFEIGTLTS